MRLIKYWFSGQSHFIHQTSGSTGTPKKIQISRDKIEYSAHATLNYLGLNTKHAHSLLCLNSTFIGGAMVVYRALIFKHNLTIVSPSTNILTELDQNETFDLTSMAPLQFENLDEVVIPKFGTILIGGAPMPIIQKAFDSDIYSTFGMTETVSHIALRKINNTHFKTTGDTIVGLNTDDTLKIKGTITDHKWLNTNDLAEIIDSKTFKWIGRKDFVINSGGIKVNPETVEELISNQFAKDFMIGSLPDERLGQRVILLCEEDKKDIDFSTLPKYSVPKEVYFNRQIIKTPSNKIDRINTLKNFESKL
ncbi:AMP-binding protein [Ekhidna sp.]|uniref:AMP-binding protein n=1 Tax=Ekhidna sp. TaxID=2608089 RepID=UPI003CCC38E3